MNALPVTQEAPNIVALPTRKRAQAVEARFKVIEYVNPRTGSKSFRVAGIKRDGERIRENFAEYAGAHCRQIELETEYMQGRTVTTPQATKLTPDQLRLCEACVTHLGDDWERMFDAVSHWKQSGKNHSPVESPRLDDAFTQFKAAVNADSSIRHLTRLAVTSRVNAFINSTPNMRVSDVLPETVLKFLDGMKVGDSKVTARTRINYRDGISKFFAWCMDINRKWVSVNPCTAVKIKVGDKHVPQILPVDACERLLRAAEKFKGGRLLPYLTLATFCGLRPFEARRIQWSQVNLKDGELRIEGNQSKIKRARSITLEKTEIAWLKACGEKPFGPNNLEKDFAKLRLELGFVTGKNEGPKWTKDILRHTAISHYFRLTGSYGRSAERFGNSEAIIKAHYQGRVTSGETDKFYALRPKKGGRK